MDPTTPLQFLRSFVDRAASAIQKRQFRVFRESSMDRREGYSESSGRDSSPDHSQGSEEKQFDHPDDTSRGGSRGIIDIDNDKEKLIDVVRLGKLSQVQSIKLTHVHNETFYRPLLGDLARALASGQMSALETLDLTASWLMGECSEAIGNALTSGKFPSLISISFQHNTIGTGGVEALGRAILSGNLEKLAYLNLGQAAITDKDMATLAASFQHGQTSVLPNLKTLQLYNNRFTEVGLYSLAAALRSGRLDSLESLDVDGSVNPSEDGANALVSALVLNSCLVVEVKFEWHKFPDLDRRRQQVSERNVRKRDILTGLVSSPMVPAAFGKVYLCGNPEVGKTTLRRTLQRTFWQSLWTWERKPYVEKRTKGIDVSQFSSKGTNQTENPITLLVWDMAGQQDYHLVHNAFFPDLSSSEGRATTFVVVCTCRDVEEAEKQLKYWLRYIASSCGESLHELRHVFVVINNIGGDRKVRRHDQDLKAVLEGHSYRFRDLLKVRTDLFVRDVRTRREVRGLKTTLLEHSRNMLRNEEVPEMCQIIRESLSVWSTPRKHFPVLFWEEFVKEVRQLLIDQWPETIIDAATRYLSEAGVLIFIDKEFPYEWDIPYQKLVVLDPNWFCRDVIGNIFLPTSMVNKRHYKLFREAVVKAGGSVLISDFKDFFKSLLGEWSDPQFGNIIAILLWLGLCYKGKNQNVFIPALIDKNGTPQDPWQPSSAHERGEDQWVMGFSVEHQESELALAPISLWHRFQVELAQTQKFNGDVQDNDFVADKYFVTFNVDYMHVLIEVNANEDIPIFHKISILAKPNRVDQLGGVKRKQRQVDLADDLLEILLGLWSRVCPTVEYLCRVVWPWPAWPGSRSRPEGMRNKSAAVAEVKGWVQEHGLGRVMQWAAGDSSPITEDQLLSTKDKDNVIKSVQSDIGLLRERMSEAVNLRIYPEELEIAVYGDEVPVEPTNELTTGLSHKESAMASDQTEEASQPPTPIEKILKAVKGMHDDLRETKRDVGEVYKKLNDIENMLREGFTKVLKEQKRVLRTVQDTERFFKEDKERTCPNLIYLGKKNPGVWTTLKEALSVTENARLRFACEAMYNNYRPHEVKDQQGIDVSTLKKPLRKIAPWLKVSLTVLLISAKIGANFVAPGGSLLVPNFQDWKQTSSLLEGIVWATGFPKEELDKLMIEEMGLDPNPALWNPRDVYGESRVAITDLIENLSRQKFEQKFGLRKVCLKYSDSSLYGVVWICTECLNKFRDYKLVTEVS